MDTQSKPSKKQSRPKTICIDFDGVIHSYISGWQGADVIPDPPVEGAIEALYLYNHYFHVAIYSSRSGQEGGIQAMRAYIDKHDNQNYDYRIVDKLQFPETKPPAMIYIDDRGFRFEGVFPSVEELEDLFTTWNKGV